MSMGDYMAIKSRTGYVKSYKIDIIADPAIIAGNQKRPFLVVTLTDNKNGNDNPEEFVIFRNVNSNFVNKSGTDYWAVSYSNLIQAIIATVKEAFIHRERVIIEYFVSTARDADPDEKRIMSIQINK